MVRKSVQFGFGCIKKLVIVGIGATAIGWYKGKERDSWNSFNKPTKWNWYCLKSEIWMWMILNVVFGEYIELDVQNLPLWSHFVRCNWYIKIWSWTFEWRFLMSWGTGCFLEFRTISGPKVFKCAKFGTICNYVDEYQTSSHMGSSLKIFGFQVGIWNWFDWFLNGIDRKKVHDVKSVIKENTRRKFLQF